MPSTCFNPDKYADKLHKAKHHDYTTEYTLSIYEDISYGFLGPLSLLTGIVLLYFYVRKPELRKPPGMLIMWQMFTQTVSDLNWTASGINFYYM